MNTRNHFGFKRGIFGAAKIKSSRFLRVAFWEQRSPLCGSFSPPCDSYLGAFETIAPKGSTRRGQGGAGLRRER